MFHIQYTTIVDWLDYRSACDYIPHHWRSHVQLMVCSYVKEQATLTLMKLGSIDHVTPTKIVVNIWFSSPFLMLQKYESIIFILITWITLYVVIYKNLKNFEMLNMKFLLWKIYFFSKTKHYNSSYSCIIYDDKKTGEVIDSKRR